jgi:hypothetical protein
MAEVLAEMALAVGITFPAQMALQVPLAEKGYMPLDQVAQATLATAAGLMGCLLSTPVPAEARVALSELSGRETSFRISSQLSATDGSRELVIRGSSSEPFQVRIQSRQS